MYRKIERLETAAAQLRRELDELKQNAAAPVGFPWALVIRILSVVLAYLIQHAITKEDQGRFIGLQRELLYFNPTQTEASDEQ